MTPAPLTHRPVQRLFRSGRPGLPDYAGLALFAVVYLAAMALVIAPGLFLDAPGTVSPDRAALIAPAD